MHYRTQGVCSSDIQFQVVDGKLTGVTYSGGCHGNLQGIGKLVEGMDIHDVISKLDGIRCGYKSTSCPDQLAQALKKYLAQQA